MAWGGGIYRFIRKIAPFPRLETLGYNSGVREKSYLISHFIPVERFLWSHYCTSSS